MDNGTGGGEYNSAIYHRIDYNCNPCSIPDPFPLIDISIPLQISQ